MPAFLSAKSKRLHSSVPVLTTELCAILQVQAQGHTHAEGDSDGNSWCDKTTIAIKNKK